MSNSISFKVGIYIRLSKEDLNKDIKNESESIINQRSLLLKYVDEHNFLLVDEYVDDGYSGTTFDRPGFNRMIKDIESGKINTVITKDLSRLGRDYIKSGYYIEQYFPLKNVRYISILDGIDTYFDSSYNDIAPFKALFNDMVSKDTSRKIRSILRNKKESGLFLGSSAAFGYLKDPLNKHKLIIDKRASVIVREIFDLALDGNSMGQICEILNKKKVVTPIIYKKKKITSRCKNPELWTVSSVRNILKNPVYMGMLVQCRQAKLSYKSNKRILLDNSSWIIKDNMHEAIVTKEEFFLVNKKAYSKISRKVRKKLLLEGLLYCKECGCLLGARRDYRYEDKWVVNCNKYARNPKLKLCSSHFMSYSFLESKVLESVKVLFKTLNTEKIVTYFSNEFFDVKRRDFLSLKKVLEDKLLKLEDKLMDLYEDKFNGVISGSTYYKLICKVESDIKLAKDELKEALKAYEKDNLNIDISSLINKLFVGNFPRELLFMLIDKIYVTKDRKIEIVYKVKCPK